MTMLSCYGHFLKWAGSRLSAFHRTELGDGLTLYYSGSKSYLIAPLSKWAKAKEAIFRMSLAELPTPLLYSDCKTKDLPEGEWLLATDGGVWNMRDGMRVGLSVPDDGLPDEPCDPDCPTCHFTHYPYTDDAL